MARSRITIRDVAARAGVSHQTVSRVINNSKRVRPATRARVEKAIAELGYRPNAIARHMARGHTSTLACIAPNLTDYTFVSIIDGAETDARHHDYFLLSASARDEETFICLMDDLVDSRRVEGIMVINPYADRRSMHLPLDFPTVFAGAQPREGEINSIALDDEMVGHEATRHLLDLLHRDIAMITGPMSEDATQDRCQGYERALREVGIESEPHWVIEGDWSARSGHDALMQLATADSLPSAIFAQNDLMAAGVMRATKDLGLEVPHNLSVIGVDDIPLSAFLDPPLDTFHQDFQLIGHKAASLLIQSINQPDAHSRQLRLPAELIERRSTTVFEPKS